MFRYLIEDFLLEYHQNIEPECFELKGKRVFLKEKEKLELILEVSNLLKRRIPYERRNYSKRTRVQTIINEETKKLGQYLRKKEIYPDLNFYSTRAF